MDLVHVVDTVAAFHPHLHLGHHLGHLRHNIDHYLDRVDIPAVVVLESIGGAACYGLSSVLQHRAASEAPPELAMRPGLLLSLLRSPRWMLGNLADIGGFALQFLALRRGALALVMPLFVTGLAFSLVGNAVADHRRPGKRELAAALTIVVGLAIFIAAARPGPGFPRSSAIGWVALFSATAAIAGGAVLLAHGTARRRALLLAVATGVLYGVTSAVTEHTGHLLNGGIVHTLVSWSPYVLVVVSIVGLLVNQSAYQAGDLRLSLPLLTVLEPVVAIAIGQFLFGEHIAGDTLSRVGEVGGLAVMTVGVFALARTVPDLEVAAAPV